jgi:hypothetical protein
MKKFSVPVCEKTFRIMEKLAQTNGFQWINSMKDNESIPYNSYPSIGFNIPSKEMMVLHGSEYITVPIDKGISLLTGILFVTPIKLGAYDVKFTDDGIEVGCQKVTKDQIKEIYNRVFGEAKC